MRRFYFKVQLASGAVVEVKIVAATGREATAKLLQQYPDGKIVAGPVQVG